MHWLTAFAFLFLRESRPVVGGLLKHLDQIFFSSIVISFSCYRYSSLSVSWLSNLFPSRLLSLDLALRYPPLLVLLDFSLLYSGNLSRLFYYCGIFIESIPTVISLYGLFFIRIFPFSAFHFIWFRSFWFSLQEFFSGLFFFSSNYILSY